VAAKPDFLTVYYLEKKALSILMKIMLWHGSCFSLYCRIQASERIGWGWARRLAWREIRHEQ
jgi:hypothetical protein